MTREELIKGIYLYGFYPSLLLLKEFQDKEEYEICNSLKGVLNEVFKGRENWLNSSTDKVNIDRAFKLICLEFNNPDTYINNLPFYVEKLKRFLNV